MHLHACVTVGIVYVFSIVVFVFFIPSISFIAGVRRVHINIHYIIVCIIVWIH